MRNYTDETGRTIKANNYVEAAQKLYNNTDYQDPKGGGLIPTVYVYKHNGYADVAVFKIGDKQGTYWGVQRAIPAKHKLTVAK